MDDVLRRQLRVADAILEVAASRVGLGAEDVPARMQGPQPVEGRLEPVRERVIGGVHASEQCVAAGRRHFAGIEHRTHRRHQIVAVVGVPAIADVLLLLWLLTHFGDHRIAGHRRKEAVDVDAAKAAGKAEVLLRRQLLVAEENDAVLAKGVADFGQRRLCRRCRQIDVADLGANRRRKRLHPNVVVGHGPFPSVHRDQSNSASDPASSSGRHRRAICECWTRDASTR